MSSLFVLGNGFDIAHQIPTTYKNFKKYMCEIIYDRKFNENEKPPIINKLPDLPPPQIYAKSCVIANQIAECNFLYFLIDKAAKHNNDMDWNEFEFLLGIINWEEVLDFYGCESDTISILTETLNTLEKFFFDWVSNIVIDPLTETKKYLVNHLSRSNDLAISFNYTDTIEKLYGLKENNVCYIHGRRETDPELMRQKKMTVFGQNNEQLIVGHDGAYCEALFNDLDNEGEINSALKHILLTLHSCLYKDSSQIIIHHREFYNKIRNAEIENVYSYGFSFSKVDNLQIREVCNALNKNCSKTKKMTWHFTKFDNEKGNDIKFIKIVRDLGFEGNFAIFDLDEDI